MITSRVVGMMFLMGSPASEAERDTDEPQHRVNLNRSFAIATRAVTWNNWEACARGRNYLVFSMAKTP